MNDEENAIMRAHLTCPDPTYADRKILRTWKKAISGDAKAQYHLGYCYENGIGVDKCLFLAATWYDEASEQGYGKATKAIGDLIWGGPDHDFDHMWRLLNKMCELGDPEAMKYLGTIYWQGHGVKKSYEKAVD